MHGDAGRAAEGGTAPRDSCAASGPTTCAAWTVATAWSAASASRTAAPAAATIELGGRLSLSASTLTAYGVPPHIDR